MLGAWTILLFLGFLLILLGKLGKVLHRQRRVSTLEDENVNLFAV